jgi:hypothetical protein
MPKIPKDKTLLQVYIDKSLASSLRSLVKMKYESFRGGLSKEVEDALRSWLAAHTSSTQILVSKAANPQPRTARVWEEVKQYLRRKYPKSYPAVISGMTIPASYIIEAISSLRGDDERTVRKWITRFEQHHLLKRIGAAAYEVI